LFDDALVARPAVKRPDVGTNLLAPLDEARALAQLDQVLGIHCRPLSAASNQQIDGAGWWRGW
jgi:hypothetical protein